LEWTRFIAATINARRVMILNEIIPDALRSVFAGKL
jgi:hypothetical protein